MGLDMYLVRVRKVKLDKTEFDAEETKEIMAYDSKYVVFFGDAPEFMKNIVTEVVLTDIPYFRSGRRNVQITEGNYEAAYWRKANQIRNWFVKHLDGFDYSDNGEYYTVTEGILEELIDDCNKVLENHDLAEEILPTSSGFFFGSYDYDDWYFSQLESTVKQLTEVIATTDWNSEVVVYTESW